MENPLISVIVPVYKVPIAFLRKCLDSLKDQTYRNLEVIVIDDGTPDAAVAAACEEYRDVFTIIHKKNEGVSVARNLGIERAKGQWISFVDADDWTEPNMFAELVEVLYSHETIPDFVLCDCRVEFEKRSTTNHFYPQQYDFIWNDHTKRNMILQIMGKNKFYNPPEVAVGVPWAKLYRADFLRGNRLLFQPELRRMQDNIFNLYAADAATSVIYTPFCLYHYRKFEQSTSNRFSPNVIEDFEKVLIWTNRFIQFIPYDEVLEQAYYARVIQSIFSYLKFWIFHPDNSLSYKEEKKILREILQKDLYSRALSQIQWANSTSSISILRVLLSTHMFYLLRCLVTVREHRRVKQKG